MLTAPLNLTVDEAAIVLRVNHRTVKDWARKGKIPATKIGGLWRISVDALLRHIGDEPSDESRSRVVEVLAAAAASDEAAQ